MSIYSDNDDSDISISTSNILFEGEQDDLLLKKRRNSIENDEEQFIFDEEFGKLICIGINFEDIPWNILHDYSLKTKILDLSGNNFCSLSSIQNFPYLEELILDGNNLDDYNTNFPKLSHLQTLMLNKNNFKNIFQLIEQIRQAYPTLQHLSLLGNAACPCQIHSTDQISSTNAFAQNRLEENYRHLVIYRIPTLKFLDSREITANERRLAMQLGDILYSIAEMKKLTVS